MVVISAKTESELSSINGDQSAYLKDLGVEKSLETVNSKALRLGLITFLTAEKEVRAWTITME